MKTEDQCKAAATANTRDKFEGENIKRTVITIMVSIPQGTGVVFVLGSDAYFFELAEFATSSASSLHRQPALDRECEPKRPSGPFVPFGSLGYVFFKFAEVSSSKLRLKIVGICVCGPTLTCSPTSLVPTYCREIGWALASHSRHDHVNLGWLQGPDTDGPHAKFVVWIWKDVPTFRE
ncbi:hypothetical protein HD554DRAFT_2040484 [Boletus coccyginus]|nr:hypothetical protein HD554DRAFT_2040484 [Boletus coccyginus]